MKLVAWFFAGGLLAQQPGVFRTRQQPPVFFAQDWGGCCITQARYFFGDSGNLYWEQGNVEDPQPSPRPVIRMLGKNGGQAQVLATVEGRTTYLSRCEGGLCWTNVDQLMFLPDGGKPRVVAKAPDEMECVATDGKWMFWKDRGASNLRRLELARGKVEDVLAGKNWPKAPGRMYGDANLAAMYWSGEQCGVLDESNFYFLEHVLESSSPVVYGAYLDSIPRTGGTPRRMAKLAPGTTTLSHMTVDGTAVYFVRWPSRRAPPGSPWFGEIVRVGKADGAASSVVSMAEQVTAMAKLGLSIAYATHTGEVKIVRNGVTTVAGRKTSADTLVIDDKAVYWADGSRGILRVSLR